MKVKSLPVCRLIQPDSQKNKVRAASNILAE
jgi:hypothetical protein